MEKLILNPIPQLGEIFDESKLVLVSYEHAYDGLIQRRVLPHAIYYGTCEPYHSEPQYLLETWDPGSREVHTLAMMNVVGWNRPLVPGEFDVSQPNVARGWMQPSGNPPKPKE